MLQTLAEQSMKTWISLPLENEPGREDLFHKALGTRDGTAAAASGPA